MKSILISIQPHYVFLIIARLMGWNIPQEKTVDARKDFPKDHAWNKRVHIYCSKNRRSFNRIPAQYKPFMEKLLGKVVGEFVCDRIDKYECHNELPYDKYDLSKNALKNMCLICHDVDKYGAGKIIYGWRISDLKIYDKPKELGKFKHYVDCENSNKLCSMCKYSWRDCNGILDCDSRLTRPPQSLCYVEEL